MSGTKTINRYSHGFKVKVVTEIELGKKTIAQARKIYDIKGGSTIQNWIKKLGKNHLIAKVVRIEMKDEKDKFKELEHQKTQLESALAQAHLKIICLEALVNSAENFYGIDITKKFDTMASPKPSTKSTGKK